ncbi:pentapeptide repeat-containing protein [Micromonospora haikouensis]|uniref:pentapeptide repeat-containing protein n=1 Tax=Micromonospora haikouensis TaxID=686309 RepID=UPI001F51744E|nr:pentapeptide repeat-containing protein [Micromonospora haikouensis]
MTKRWSVSLIAAGVLGLLGVALTQFPTSWWRVLASSWAVLLPVAASLTVLILGVLLWCRSTEEHQASAAPTAPDRQVHPLRSWVIPVGVALVAVATWAAVAWLQGSVPAVGDEVQRAQLRVESIRTGLTIGGAVAAAFALLLAFRRQQLAERSQQATEYDAGEKRVTDLYVKAADQLGSDKAPVRLAGLYALERLAQDNPLHRKSIAEVICAYLRMPYIPPPIQPAPTNQARANTDRISLAPADAREEDDETAVDPREERQVRLAAQRILARHLHPTTQGGGTNPSYWGPNLALDLTEATLINVDFAHCHLHNARFNKATFSGDTSFGGTTFSGSARFIGATFGGDAWFRGATFSGSAMFLEATFHGAATFPKATFNGSSVFRRAKFCGAAGFHEAMFGSVAEFGEATFSRAARFGEASFSRAARFGRATFSGVAGFENATFSGSRDFEGANLGGVRYDGPNPVSNSSAKSSS